MFMRAAAYDNLPMVEFFVERGVDLEYEDFVSDAVVM